MELFTLFLVAVFGIAFVSSSFRVLSAWERAVILRLGKFNRVAGPGIIFLIPLGIDRAYRVDTRVVTMDVPRQDMMTRDNVPVTVDAIVLFSVIDPRSAILNIENYIRTTSLIAQTTLRSTIGQAELDELLAQRDRINATLQAEIDVQTEPYGVKVHAVEVRDVSLPETMKRAMAAQAEAERDKRAKVINAEGEYMAAERLTQAAAMMSSEPAALQLRYLQSMREIAAERSTMAILPVPVDLLTPFIEMAKRASEARSGDQEARRTQSAPDPPAQPGSLPDPGIAPGLPAAGPLHTSHTVPEA
ncbi:MAG: slipin family protein [Chloroherpetonaceae bacterium]|nr:slipin family protein [Chthonomonadaceae bacterium]MDW8208682.1 slipin family protein [Chloroherpetonaceae bacterium]